MSHLDSYFDKIQEFPVNEKLFTDKLQTAMEKDEQPKTYAIAGAEVIPVYELTTKQADRLRRVIDESEPFPQWKNRLILLILDEANYYLSDSKTLEEVTNIIQSRAEIYLQEYLCY